SDDVVALPPRHDLFHVRDLVSGNDGELRGFGPELFVRLRRQRDLLDTLAVAALTHENEPVGKGRERLVEILNPLVRLAEDRFVDPYAPFPFVHGSRHFTPLKPSHKRLKRRLLSRNLGLLARHRHATCRERGFPEECTHRCCRRGGKRTAATILVTSKNIKNGTIQTVDISVKAKRR